MCLLILLGHDHDEALHIVGAHRPMAGPEVGAQRDLVNELWIRVAGSRKVGGKGGIGPETSG